MFRKGLIHLVFVAFWGMFFQCQPGISVAGNRAEQAAPGQGTKSGFCKKKLLSDQHEVRSISVGEHQLKPCFTPADLTYLGAFFQRLLALSGLADSSKAPFGLAEPRWLTQLHKANPNKAPPVLLLS